MEKISRRAYTTLIFEWLVHVALFGGIVGFIGFVVWCMLLKNYYDLMHDQLETKEVLFMLSVGLILGGAVAWKATRVLWKMTSNLWFLLRNPYNAPDSLYDGLDK